MAYIKFDVEFAQQLAARLEQLVSVMQEDTYAFQSAVDQAEGDWQGQLYNRFRDQYEPLRSLSNTALQEGQELAQWMRQEIARFQESDAGSAVF
jgi:uncharacterized protein YukE